MKNTDLNPIFSYLEIDTNQFIQRIVEKQKISDNANTGIYCFQDIYELYNYSEQVVCQKITMANECYLSCIIDLMLKDNHLFQGIELCSSRVFCLGTPEQVNNYIERTHLFLFDLDGTLVLTDNMYYESWREILQKYCIEITPEIFNKYISGNNDKNVIQSLIPNYLSELGEISVLKDKLFIENIEKIKLVQGTISFLKECKEKGHLCCVVTNCNRLVSEKIIEYLNLTSYFEFIVVGNETERPKPYPDPYQKAIELFRGTNNKSIIFEDSKTGLLSAKAVIPKCIVGLETQYTHDELINHSADITISDYTKNSVEDFLYFQNNDIKQLKHHIIFSVMKDKKYEEKHIINYLVKYLQLPQLLVSGEHPKDSSLVVS
jgi:HAD superfamily hydrolase (TIGR01509 family)